MPRIPRVATLAAAGLAMAIALVIGIVFVTNAVAATNSSCSCVTYVRSQTGLPGGPANAAGYTESVMNRMGYRKVLPQPRAILVWDAKQKGAYSDGHMAIISSASYNAKTKKWVISVRHVNWLGSCSVRSDTFTWGDLYGVNAYVRR